VLSTLLLSALAKMSVKMEAGSRTARVFASMVSRGSSVKWSNQQSHAQMDVRVMEIVLMVCVSAMLATRPSIAVLHARNAVLATDAVTTACANVMNLTSTRAARQNFARMPALEPVSVTNFLGIVHALRVTMVRLAIESSQSSAPVIARCRHRASAPLRLRQPLPLSRQ